MSFFKLIQDNSINDLIKESARIKGRKFNWSNSDNYAVNTFKTHQQYISESWFFFSLCISNITGILFSKIYLHPYEKTIFLILCIYQTSMLNLFSTSWIAESTSHSTISRILILFFKMTIYIVIYIVILNMLFLWKNLKQNPNKHTMLININNS